MVEAECLIRLLYENGCVQFRETPFTWSSGMQAPIYVDHRRLFGVVSARRQFVQAFSVLSGAYEPDAVAGVGDAATPWGAWVSEKLDIPFLMVRKSGKQHGLLHAVEGSIFKFKRVLLVEDVITTGSSVWNAMTHLDAAGHQEVAVVTALDYGLPRNHAFQAASLNVVSLYEFPLLVDIGYRFGFFDDRTCSLLNSWHDRTALGGAVGAPSAEL